MTKCALRSPHTSFLFLLSSFTLHNVSYFHTIFGSSSCSIFECSLSVLDILTQAGIEFQIDGPHGNADKRGIRRRELFEPHAMLQVDLLTGPRNRSFSERKVKKPNLDIIFTQPSQTLIFHNGRGQRRLRVLATITVVQNFHG